MFLDIWNDLLKQEVLSKPLINQMNEYMNAFKSQHEFLVFTLRLWSTQPQAIQIC